jgi:predicted small secreted protein
MKLTTRTLLVLILIGVQSLVVAGCANTGRGIKADTKRNVDKVEDAVDR